MNEESALLISHELIKKIDQYRGSISQQDFIRLCVDSYLRRRTERTGEEQFVTKAELLEFQQHVKELERGFIEFILSYAVDLGGW